MEKKIGPRGATSLSPLPTPLDPSMYKISHQKFVIGDSVELPKWLKLASGIKTSAKKKMFVGGGGTIGIGRNQGVESL